MSDFRVGQDIVCINDDFPIEYYIPWEATGTLPTLPRKKIVYTVRGLINFKFNRDYHEGLYLEEIINPVLLFSDGQHCEHPFWVCRFRPVVTRQTSIEVFRRLLVPRKELVR